MSEIRINIIDQNRTISGDIHGSFGDVLVAALTAEPESVEEFEAAVSALRGKKPFRKFKDVLIYHREFEQKWFDFEARKLREFIEEWAESEQIEIEFKDAGNS